MKNAIKLPFWYFLLLEWCVKRRNNGLTIPFIIGAISYKLNESYSIFSLLAEMNSHKTPNTVILGYCTRIQENILEINTNPFGLEAELIKLDEMFLRPNLFDTDLEVNSIFNILDSKYFDNIEAGHYSINADYIFDVFSPADIKLINESFNSYINQFLVL